MHHPHFREKIMQIFEDTSTFVRLAQFCRQICISFMWRKTVSKIFWTGNYTLLELFRKFIRFYEGWLPLIENQGNNYLFLWPLCPPLRYEVLSHHCDQPLSFYTSQELFGHHSHLNIGCNLDRVKKMTIPDAFLHPLFCFAPPQVSLGKLNY